MKMHDIDAKVALLAKCHVSIIKLAGARPPKRVSDPQLRASRGSHLFSNCPRIAAREQLARAFAEVKRSPAWVGTRQTINPSGSCRGFGSPTIWSTVGT